MSPSDSNIACLCQSIEINNKHVFACMFLFENVCVCMYVRMHVRTYVRTHARTYICMYVFTYVCMYVLVPSNIVACFRVRWVGKKIPEFSWLHCGRRHLGSHVTVRDHTMACHFFLRPTKCFFYDGWSASMRSL